MTPEQLQSCATTITEFIRGGGSMSIELGPDDPLEELMAALPEDVQRNNRLLIWCNE